MSRGVRHMSMWGSCLASLLLPQPFPAADSRSASAASSTTGWQTQTCQALRKENKRIKGGCGSEWECRDALQRDDRCQTGLCYSLQAQIITEMMKLAENGVTKYHNNFTICSYRLDEEKKLSTVEWEKYVKLYGDKKKDAWKRRREKKMHGVTHMHPERTRFKSKGKVGKKHLEN